MPFKVKFDLMDYRDILPVPPDAPDVLNYEYYIKGDYDNCIWRRHEDKGIKDNVKLFERESRRILKDGVWIFIKDQLIWLPPNYYFALQYGRAGSDFIQFRVKRLKHVYFKIRARKNPECIGVFSVKNRQDGETTMAIIDCLHEVLSTKDGQIGLQSKNRESVINPCWKTLVTQWMNLPLWLKSTLFSSFSSGKNIAETMKFMEEATEDKDGEVIPGKNVLISYFPSTFNAMDGCNSMVKCILDENLKWVNCNFGDTLDNYSKFIMPGPERRGMFEIFSSPPEKDSQSYKDGYSLWLRSNTDELQENGTTKSRIHRYFSNPLEGIQGMYDKWGDADPEECYRWIMRERALKDKDKLLNEIRGFPLNEEEMWGTLEGGDFWSNQKGIAERKIWLLGNRFKNPITQEPIVIYGNLEWKDGIKDSEVVFRQSDRNEFNVHDARFCISFLPTDYSILSNIYRPPNYVEFCIGVDSVDKRHAGKRPSNFAMVCQKFRDAEGTGIVRCPVMIYCNRPLPIEISYEDAIKAAVFWKAKVQVESLNTSIVNWFEDRGYIDWMISKIGKPQNSLVKGDAPSGNSTAFIDEIVGMVDSITNVPYNEGDPYPLEINYFYALLDDTSKLNLKDTHERDLFMAWGQSLLGCAKLLFKKHREKSDFNTSVFSSLLG